MGLFHILNILLYGFFGVLVLNTIRRDWNKPNRINHKYTEVLIGILYFVVAIIVYYVFEDIDSKQDNILQLIIFISNFTGCFILEVFHIHKFRNKCKDDEEFYKERNYDDFIKELSASYEKEETSKRKDIIKDLTRKMLHVVIFVIYFILQSISESDSMQLELDKWNLTPSAFKNIICIILASFFLLMFTIEGHIRIVNFPYSPDWARKWIFKSLDHRNESYTYISSVPFLLSLISIILIPSELFYTAVVISCLSDSAASVIGKSWGEHKLGTFGNYPKKSWEGVIAGALFSYLGIFLIFYNHHAATNTIIDNILGIIAAITFILIDLFVTKIADNIINTILPPFILYLTLLFFGIY